MIFKRIMYFSLIKESRVLYQRSLFNAYISLYSLVWISSPLISWYLPSCCSYDLCRVVLFFVKPKYLMNLRVCGLVNFCFIALIKCQAQSHYKLDERVDKWDFYNKLTCTFYSLLRLYVITFRNKQLVGQNNHF